MIRFFLVFLCCIILILFGVGFFEIYVLKSNFSQTLLVSNIVTRADTDQDGIDDIHDILAGARVQVQKKIAYKDGYFIGGYPDNNTGVCTDVIWAALQEMGYNLKNAVDTDIKNHLREYPRVQGTPDPNIDFRRVPNLKVFFERNFLSLTTHIIPGDIENLKEWQAGDIVIFMGNKKDHIAIISDKRNSSGVPYIIHNSSPYPQENDMLTVWDKKLAPIVGHYRIVKNYHFEK